MSDAAPHAIQQAITELTVTGRLMALDAGAYCVFQSPGTAPADAQSGLPGVRISAPPAANGYAGLVELAGFGAGGWLAGAGDASLIRITGGPAQVLVTIYELPGSGHAAPQLQVIRLTPDAPAQPEPALQQSVPPEPAVAPEPVMPEVSAHIYGVGDVAGQMGAWIGERGSKRWIEGFGMAPHGDVALADIEYQGVLGRGWLSPWSEGGQFCGSRGMSLPLLGLRVRLRGAAAERFSVRVEGTFVDGTALPPVTDGALLEAPSLSALEAFRVELLARVTRAAKPSRKPAAKAQAAQRTLKTKKIAVPVPVPVADAAPAKPVKKAPAKRTPATTRRR